MSKATEEKLNADECGSGCDCNRQGLSTKVKVIVCLIIGLAAVAVLARGIINKTGADTGCDPATGSSCCP